MRAWAVPGWAGALARVSLALWFGLTLAFASPFGGVPVAQGADESLLAEIVVFDGAAGVAASYSLTSAPFDLIPVEFPDIQPDTTCFVFLSNEPVATPCGDVVPATDICALFNLQAAELTGALVPTPCSEMDRDDPCVVVAQVIIPPTDIGFGQVVLPCHLLGLGGDGGDDDSDGEDEGGEDSKFDEGFGGEEAAACTNGTVRCELYGDGADDDGDEVGSDERLECWDAAGLHIAWADRTGGGALFGRCQVPDATATTAHPLLALRRFSVQPPVPSAPLGIQQVAAVDLQLKPISTPNFVNLNFNYDPALVRALGIPETGLRMFYYHEGLGAWVEMPATVNLSAHTVTSVNIDISAFADRMTRIGIFG